MGNPGKGFAASPSDFCPKAPGLADVHPIYHSAALRIPGATLSATRELFGEEEHAEGRREGTFSKGTASGHAGYPSDRASAGICTNHSRPTQSQHSASSGTEGDEY